MGVIDLLKMKAIVWEDETLGAGFHETPVPPGNGRAGLLVQRNAPGGPADKDDEIMAKYLSEEPIEAQDLKRVIRGAAVRLEVVPVLCGAALRNKGIQPLLDALVDFLPHPLISLVFMERAQRRLLIQCIRSARSATRCSRASPRICRSSSTPRA